MSTASYRPNGAQPVAGPSKPSARHLNPQLSSEPWFAYPEPPPGVVDAELPPYVESENVPMGVMLDRLARSAHVQMGSLVQDNLPKLDPRQRPKAIIGYAKHTRQSVLKYLAVLRWKLRVDIPTILPTPEGQPSFPTPHSNGDSYSPASGPKGKGKGKMTDEDVKVSIRGKVTDAKRIAEYMKHQNDQHDMAVSHVRHTATNIETLRIRNPDLLTALSLLTTGTYNRLPTDITESFVPRPILTNASILDTLRRLDAHILYRLRCVDYVPPDIRIDKIQDGRAYVTGGNGQWHAELSLTGFGTGMQGRYWLTGIEWGWSAAGKEGEHSTGKRFKGNERQQILDLVNREVLPPEDAGHDPSIGISAVDKADARTEATPLLGSAGQADSTEPVIVDAPLVRLANFIQHLSLTYQLETLFAQAIALSREKWRGHLLVDIDRAKKSLTLKYWIRPRTAPPVQPAGQNKRVGPAAPSVNMRIPMVGATLTISIGEAEETQGEVDVVKKAISECDAIASERVLTLGLKVTWEIGEAGVGGGWKTGDNMDVADLRLDPSALSIADILLPATRAHAAHLIRIYAAPLTANSTRLISPSLESKPGRPVTLYVPVPARRRKMDLSVSVSHVTGRIQIEDEGAKFSAGSGGDERANRTRQATFGVNAGSTPLGEALRRLVMAIYTDSLEGQMRQLGWTPSRKLPIKLGELAEYGLVPASTIFIPLPTSDLHFLVVRITVDGVVFELLRIARIPAENGIGLKLAVKDRESMDLNRLRQRRLAADRKRKAPGEELIPELIEPQAFGFEVDTKDLKDLFIFSNCAHPVSALVAQMLVEQQLKDRSIPYIKRYPEATGPSAPLSSSAVAGMIPTIRVEVSNLLQDHRAADVAMPHVFLQLKDWWKGGKCQVVTIVRLKHQTSTSPAGSSPGLNDASTSSAARAEGITFDQATSVVKFTAKDISRCVQAFLEQWERLSKVIMVAGDVNRLNKLSVFRDLRMLSFDLRTATFSYSPGFNASITYSSTSDSYECIFTRASPVNTPGTPATISAEASPHEVLGPLLSHRLNELTRSEDVKKGTVGRDFITLLRNTLPLLLEIESIRARSTSNYPALVISAVDHFRLAWDVQATNRYAVDITLLPDDRYLLSDASSPSPDGLVDLSCGTLTPLPDFASAVDKTYGSLRTAEAGDHTREVLAVKLDRGSSLAVRVRVIGEAVRSLCREIEATLGDGGTGKSE